MDWVVRCDTYALQLGFTSHPNPIRINIPSEQLAQGGSATVESLQPLYTETTGDVSGRHLFVRVAYLQDERQLARVSPVEFGFLRPEQRLPFTL